MDTVKLLSIDHGMHCPVDVEKQPVLASIPGEGSVGREPTGDVVVHDDGYA